MSAKHHRRHRPPHQRGGNAPRAAVPIPRRRSRWRLALLLPVLGALALAGWFALSAWRHSGQTPREPPASPFAQTDLPANAPSPRSAAHAADNHSELSLQMNRGNELLAQGKPAEAAQVLTEAIRLNPQNEDVHYNLGLALARLGRFEEATQQYGEALRIFPDYAEAHNNLGNVLMHLERNQEALWHFEQAVKIMPDYASAHNNLGTALQKAGRTNDALAHFREAVKLAPDYWQAHFNLGTSCRQEGRVSEARSEFETVLRLHPDFGPAKSALAAIQAQQPGGASPKP
ncbi:MAG: tetratricopeptide repeat protein [Verrucomicrobiota bacterium]